MDEGLEDKAKLAFLHCSENIPAPDGEAQPHGWEKRYREKARIALTERMAPGEPEYACERPQAPLVKTRRRKTRYPPAPVPTWTEFVEFAKVLAIDEGGVNRNCMRLIAWTAGEQLKMTGKTFARHIRAALAWRDKARRALTERMELDHRRRLHRLHREKLRKTQCGCRWTRRLRGAQPLRRRGIPFWLTALMHGAARSHSPPDRILPASPSVKRSQECPRKELLCFAGGGHRPGVLRQRSLWNPLPQCNARSLTTEEYAIERKPLPRKGEGVCMPKRENQLLRERFR